MHIKGLPLTTVAPKGLPPIAASSQRKPDPLEVIFENADWVAVNKPAGLAAIPGRGETDSVLQRLGRQISLPTTGKADPRLRLVHRIDKDTTGVMLFAKHTSAQRQLSHQFQNNRLVKEYLALVNGRVGEDEGVVEAALWQHPTDKLRMAIARKGGRPAVTAWKVEQRLKRFTLVRCFPKTGKTHQIRVHMAHIGHPLVIDPLYGSGDPILLSEHKRRYRPTKGQDERPLIARLTLHAAKLIVTDPLGQEVCISAALPKDFRATLNQLHKA